MADWLKKFDVHVKALDGVRKRTLPGAILTLASSTFIVLLCFSELLVFSSVKTVHHMTVDSAAAEQQSVRISLHATFPHLACDSMNLEVEATRGDPTMDVVNSIVKTPVGEGGCSLKGELVVGKVGGNFHISTGMAGLPNSPVLQLSSGLMSATSLMGHFQGVNMSHTIHHLSFGPDFPGRSNPLEEVTNVVSTDVGQYQFHIKVIPTVYKYLRRSPVHSHQFSISEQFVKLDLMSALKASSAPGIFFYYDFYPVMVEYDEEKVSILQFLTRICGIIGGIFTVSGLIDGFLHQSYQQLKKAA